MAVSPTSITLDTPTNSVTVIDLDSTSGKIRIKYGSIGTPVALNANNTKVTALTFTNNTSPDYKTQNIQYSFTIDDTLVSSRQEYSLQPITMQGSAEVRTPLLATPTPTPIPTATPIPQAVTSLILEDAATHNTIMTLVNGGTIDLATLSTTTFNVKAITSPATVGSVKFDRDGTVGYAIENTSPYEQEGNTGAWTMAVGSHTLKATPYTATGATGTAGTALTITFTVINTPTPTPRPAWPYRKMITIQDTKVMGSTNFSNFTVLISLTDPDLGANAQTNGNDIKFTASDGITKLYHEIESYTKDSSGNGVLLAWVKIPTLNASANTVIYMYYGNTTASSQQTVCTTSTSSCAWDPSYKGVWHLSEASNATRLDSTGNNNDLIDVNSNTTKVSGKIGSAASFSGTAALGRSDGSQLGLDITGKLTVESWVKFSAVGSTVDIAAKNGADPQHAYYLRLDGGSNRFDFGVSKDGTSALS